MVPERCPVCGGYTAVRDFLYGVGVSDGARKTRHSKRVVVYCSAAVEDTDSVCAECADIITKRTV
jgi:predicted nucleic acid-binding Zn ribbon protein